jgi:hypothetical protein
MNPSEQADLNWLAFCYVAGEASADEIEEFERRLAVDQAAREAVAQAVELCQAVASIPSQPQAAEPPTPARRRWELLAGWTALAAAVALFARAVGLNLRVVDEQVSVARADVSLATRLVDVWTQSREVFNDPVGADVSLAEDELAAADPQDEDRLGDGGADDAIVVPGWMLTAVESTLVPDSPATDPRLQEN